MNIKSQTSQEPETETAIGVSGMSLKNAVGKIRLWWTYKRTRWICSSRKLSKSCWKCSEILKLPSPAEPVLAIGRLLCRFKNSSFDFCEWLCKALYQHRPQTVESSRSQVPPKIPSPSPAQAYPSASARATPFFLRGNPTVKKDNDVKEWDDVKGEKLPEKGQLPAFYHSSRMFQKSWCV